MSGLMRIVDARRRRSVLAGAEHTGDLGDDPARRVLIAVGGGLGAACEVLGVDHRSAFEVAVARLYLDILAAFGREQARYPADRRGRQ